MEQKLTFPTLVCHISEIGRKAFFLHKMTISKGNEVRTTIWEGKNTSFLRENKANQRES